MGDEEQVSLFKLNSLIRQGKQQKALLYIHTNNITPSMYVQGNRDDESIPRLSPLSVAAEEGDIDLVRTLIQQGFDPKARECNNVDFEEWKPIHYACSKGHVHIVRYLFEEHGVDIESPSGLNWTLLQYAVNDKDFAMVKYLVDAGASINKPDRESYSPLNISVMCNGDVDICKYLISKGAAVNSRVRDGSTPLFTAVRQYNDEMVEVLLDAGSDTEIVNDSGETPLTAAIVGGETSIVKLLISHGADANTPDSEGRSALHTALKERRRYKFDIVYYLVVNVGVSVNMKDKLGHSPTFLAFQARRLEAVELFLNFDLELACERWLMEDDTLGEMYPIQKVIVEKLRQLISNPRSLKDICCTLLIRLFVGKTFSNKVQMLPLPQLLKHHLLLKHIRRPIH